ncbi:MAG: sugar MFS transporter [Rikenellaceae bacterium]|nr:sugar MFS transporter [Rikenellaceae bacterium]
MKVHRYLFSLYVIGALFFIFGFITWINSVLIPFLQQVCGLNDFQAYLVTFAFYISYFVMALPSSWVLCRTGFARGMSIGLWVMAAGSLLFIPAALHRSYLLFLVGLFTQGSGLALLQTAANPYVTILGPIESAARRISIMGICNKAAGMIGIFLLSYLLFSDINTTAAELAASDPAHREAATAALAHKIIGPYIAITLILALLGLTVQAIRLPAVDPGSNGEHGTDGRRSIFSYPYLWLGIASLFCYVGVEVIAIDTLPLYGEYQGLATGLSARLGTFSLIALVTGYLVGILTVPRLISQRKALIVCAATDLALVIAAVLVPGKGSIALIVLLSFAHALMWPSIWPLALEGLGRHTPTASALLIMGITGGAVLPLAYGALADALGGNRQLPYLICVPCYLFILCFAVRGYRAGRVCRSPR